MGSACTKSELRGTSAEPELRQRKLVKQRLRFVEQFEQRLAMKYHRAILEPVWTDADMLALEARNEERRVAARAALGHKWLGVPMCKLVPAEPPIIIAKAAQLRRAK